jgi:hypothetical protein
MMEEEESVVAAVDKTNDNTPVVPVNVAGAVAVIDIEDRKHNKMIVRCFLLTVRKKRWLEEKAR